MSDLPRPAFRCPVCGAEGRGVEPGPEARSESRRIFAEHLDRHTQPELTAYVWKLMYDHSEASLAPLHKSKGTR